MPRYVSVSTRFVISERSEGDVQDIMTDPEYFLITYVMQKKINATHIRAIRSYVKYTNAR